MTCSAIVWSEVVVETAEKDTKWTSNPRFCVAISCFSLCFTREGRWSFAMKEGIRSEPWVEGLLSIAESIHWKSSSYSVISALSAFLERYP